MNKSKLMVAALTALGVVTLVAGVVLAGVTVDPKLPHYSKTKGVSGSIKSIGSDTMNNMMALWGEGFRSAHPDAKIEVEGKGSSTAPPSPIPGSGRPPPPSLTV